jgi:ABC-2 type transport system permease protein
MQALIKAEVRKLLTIRSTYFVTGAALLLLGILTFWAMGYKGENAPNLLQSSIQEGAGMVAAFVAIIAALNITHEYRYNTIMYTLTSANNRSKVLIAKLAVICGYALVFMVVAALLSVLLTWFGASFRAADLVPQQFFYWDMIWRSTFQVLAWALLGLMFGFLFRHVVGTIVALFLLPSTVEGLLSLLLKENIKYLPYTALEQVHTGALLSPAKGALVFSLYLAAGWLAAWVLFVRRDAN